jgi:hypothetical protein
MLESIIELVRLVARGAEHIGHAARRATREAFGVRLLDVYLRGLDVRGGGQALIESLQRVIDSVDRSDEQTESALRRARYECEAQVHRVADLASALRSIKDPLRVLDPSAADTIGRWLGVKGEVVSSLTGTLRRLAGHGDQSSIDPQSGSGFLSGWEAPLIAPYDQERAAALAEALRASGMREELDEFGVLLDRLRDLLIANFTLDEVLVHAAIRERAVGTRQIAP